MEVIISCLMDAETVAVFKEAKRTENVSMMSITVCRGWSTTHIPQWVELLLEVFQTTEEPDSWRILL